MEQYVVSRACFCRVFFNRTVIILTTWLKWDNGTPPGRSKGLVYECLPGLRFIDVGMVHAFIQMYSDLDKSL